MSKEFKEKYERVCQIKDRAISLVETQLNGNIENVDAEELGEVADIAKDMAELMELCAEAEYYHAITTAMEKNSDAENRMQMDKYLPESRFYGGGMPPIVYAGDGMSGGRGNSNTGGRGGRYYHDGKPMIYNPMDDRWNDEEFRNRMYYSNMNGGSNSNSGSNSNGNSSGSGNRYYTDEIIKDMRDPREGRAPMTRRTYMEMKDRGESKEKKTEEMKKYVHSLVDDLTEMVEGASPEEKASMKQMLANFVNKLQYMFSINGELWRICFVYPYSPILMNNDGSYTLGVTVPENRTIYLSNELYGRELDHVLTHELFHAEMVSRNVYVPIYIEEALCDLVADHYVEIFDIADKVHDNLCRYYNRC